MPRLVAKHCLKAGGNGTEAARGGNVSMTLTTSQSLATWTIVGALARTTILNSGVRKDMLSLAAWPEDAVLGCLAGGSEMTAVG